MKNEHFREKSCLLKKTCRSMPLPRGRALELGGRVLVMAVINCTEDSFYAGSRNKSAEEAVERGLRAEEEGAAIVDFGAESTRPGAEYISAEEEKRRLLPVIEAFRKRSSLVVSVDTRKAEVASLVLEAGADIINDVSALEDSPEIAALCADHGAGLILMHKKGIPASMQDMPNYEDVVREVSDYLVSAAKRAGASGVPDERIILDPGIGFGKRTVDNLELIANFDRIASLGWTTLMALSRKRFIGEVCGRDTEGRLAGTIAANAYSIMRGADIIRVHDVGEALDLVRIFDSLMRRDNQYDNQDDNQAAAFDAARLPLRGAFSSAPVIKS